MVCLNPCHMMCLVSGLRGHFSMYSGLNIFIIGASSDIGLSLAQHWHGLGAKIYGTYRVKTSEFKLKKKLFSKLIQCDFSDKDSVKRCIEAFNVLGVKWDALVLCPGTMNPIGRFDNSDMDSWEAGVIINLVAPLRMVHGLLNLRRLSKELPLVAFFAGGGTNGAPLNYSSYVTSKVALIKAVELLDAEFDSVRFTIVGPGWVKTKIHSETLDAGLNAGETIAETERRYQANEFNPMEKVLHYFDWLMFSPKDVVGGRNFSVVYDKWGDPSLNLNLRSNVNSFKLRRHSNDLQ